jgi:hypothetical protein
MPEIELYQRFAVDLYRWNVSERPSSMRSALKTGATEVAIREILLHQANLLCPIDDGHWHPACQCEHIRHVSPEMRLAYVFVVSTKIRRSIIRSQ